MQTAIPIATQTASLLIQATLAETRLHLKVSKSIPIVENAQGIVSDDGKYQVLQYRIRDTWESCSMSIDGWLSPFWKTLEEIGWRLVHKQRTSSVDYTWTLAPMKEVVATGFPTRNDLLPYVEKIRPLAGDRAQRGLELAISGKVQKVGVGDQGEDLWRVLASRGDAYSVSIKARYCTCPDAANGAPRWFDAPLCKHRIAVMYICRWQEDAQQGYCNSPTNHTETKTADTNQLTEYITIAPPVVSGQGWRWIHVYTSGKLNRSSTDEFPNREQAIQTAQVVAQCKNLPLLLMPPITKSC